MSKKRTLHRDWDYRKRRKIKAFAKRHKLTAITFTPPNEDPFVRVWFDLNDPRQAKAEQKARKLYGRTHGGYSASR